MIYLELPIIFENQQDLLHTKANKNQKRVLIFYFFINLCYFTNMLDPYTRDWSHIGHNIVLKSVLDLVFNYSWLSRATLPLQSLLEMNPRRNLVVGTSETKVCGAISVLRASRGCPSSSWRVPLLEQVSFLTGARGTYKSPQPDLSILQICIRRDWRSCLYS